MPDMASSAASVDLRVNGADHRRNVDVRYPRGGLPRRSGALRACNLRAGVISQSMANAHARSRGAALASVRVMLRPAPARIPCCRQARRRRSRNRCQRYRTLDSPDGGQTPASLWAHLPISTMRRTAAGAWTPGRTAHFAEFFEALHQDGLTPGRS